MEIIEVRNVSKSFKNQQVLKGVSLRCESGKIYGIIGRNGSGKTVLFKCICGFFHTDAGEIRIRGKVVGKDMDLPGDLGIIIEEPAFLRTVSAYRNLKFLYMIRNAPNREHLYRIIEQVGLDPKSKKHVGKFSMGMKQRLAIAQAIMEDQEILILDEPMNGLDNQGVEDMRALFLELKKNGKTILLASHNKEDVALLCDEVYRMDAGVLERVYE